jgi:hypothetical protein
LNVPMSRDHVISRPVTSSRHTFPVGKAAMSGQKM